MFMDNARGCDFQIEGDYNIYLTGEKFGKKAGPIPVSIKSGKCG